MKIQLILIIALVQLTSFVTAQDNKVSVLLAAAIYEEEVTGKLDKAVELYLDILNKYPDDRPVAAKTLYHLGLVHEKMGKQKANEYFRRLVNTYPDQTEMVAMAKAKLTAMGNSGFIGGTGVVMSRIWAAGKNLPLGISPDGRYVVFIRLSPIYSGDLWLYDLQTGKQKRITIEASYSEMKFSTGNVAISPDSRQIAYGWQVGNILELRLSSLDGSSMQVLHSGLDGKNIVPCAWMPNGRQILAYSFDRRYGTHHRYIISLPDDSIREIRQSNPRFETWGYPSPDGRKIAYGMNNDILIYDIATEQDLILVQNPAIDRMVGWTPDGSGILFLSDRSGIDGLYLLAIGNDQPRGEPELLRLNLGATAKFSLTRDGRLFRIENTGTYDSYIVTMDEQTGKLSGAPSLLDSNYPGVWNPAWSSDGKLLYYTINKGAFNDRSKVLVIRSEVTGETREITPKPIINWDLPVLSPDGRRFAVSGSDYNSNFGIFEIDLESGYVSILAKIPTENFLLQSGYVSILAKIPTENFLVAGSQSWSPDSKAIFYLVLSPENKNEYLIRHKDLTTGEEKDIYSGILTRDMKISPDGTRVSYLTNDISTKSKILSILDIQSGRQLELWRSPEVDSPGILSQSWTQDGKYVLLEKEVREGSELWRFPAVGGPGEKLYFSPDKSWRFVMHPNGKRIAFMQSRYNYELWVLENFLPK